VVVAIFGDSLQQAALHMSHNYEKTVLEKACSREMTFKALKAIAIAAIR